MLILCCGPDTFRALARAKELEHAFRQKHDPEGRAIEHLRSGKDGVEDLIEKSAGANLFSPKRFLRVDGLVTACPKNKLKALVEALSRDIDSMIVVSVEEEKPSASQLKSFEELPKFLLSEYTQLQGSAFSAWAMEYAKNLRIYEEKSLQPLIEACEGDCWSFVNEAMKLAAGATLEHQTHVDDPSPYDIADQFLRAEPTRFQSLNGEFGYTNFSIILQQAVSAVRIRDNDLDGIPPFVSRKLKAMNVPQPEAVVAVALETIFLQRTGLANEAESAVLLI